MIETAIRISLRTWQIVFYTWQLLYFTWSRANRNTSIASFFLEIIIYM